jgi:type IV secretion system protein VirB2
MDMRAHHVARREYTDRRSLKGFPWRGRQSAIAAILTIPGLAFAQASPFLTGATALQTNILAWLTPIAVILVMVLGAMAMANRMSWGWCIGAIIGIAIAFGAPQIVTWIRGMFGV